MHRPAFSAVYLHDLWIIWLELHRVGPSVWCHLDLACAIITCSFSAFKIRLLWTKIYVSFDSAIIDNLSAVITVIWGHWVLSLKANLKLWVEGEWQSSKILPAFEHARVSRAPCPVACVVQTVYFGEFLFLTFRFFPIYFNRSLDPHIRRVWYHLSNWVRSSRSGDQPRDYSSQPSTSSAKHKWGGWTLNLPGNHLIFPSIIWFDCWMNHAMFFFAKFCGSFPFSFASVSKVYINYHWRCTSFTLKTRIMKTQQTSFCAILLVTCHIFVVNTNK